jgi:hypothetical protein
MDKQIGTVLCRDVWRMNRVSAVLPYAMLQALYEDQVDGEMTTENADRFETLVRKFVEKEAMTVVSETPTGSSSRSKLNFRNVIFADFPSSVRDMFCNVSSRGPYPTKNETEIAILRKAHLDLRMLYEAYVYKVTEFARGLLTIRRRYGDPTGPYALRLDPIFIKDPKGALAVLDEKIVIGRELIADHLLKVEEIFYGALKNLARSKSGYSTNEPLSRPTPSRR